VVSAALLSIVSLPAAIGALAGGSVMSVSMLLSNLVLDATLRRRRHRLAIGLTFAKLLLLLGFVWGVLGWGLTGIDPGGLAVGITCLPLAATWEALRWRPADTKE